MASRQTVAKVLLFTDMVGSTRQWHEDAARMSRLLETHDTILAALISANRGIVFKTVGDAFCAHFASARDAISCAIDIQRGLQNELSECLVRCAIDEGEVEQRDDDLFGPPLSRVARLLRLAHGGQILISQAVRDTAGKPDDSAYSYRELGSVKLKDLTDSLTVFQIISDGIESSFPPLSTESRQEGNLPPETSEFVGREVEISEVTRLIGDHALVTLVGAGGSGKTRLSLRVARLLEPGYRDGAYCIDLSNCDASSDLHSLLLSIVGRGDKQFSLADLRHRQVLLVLDNCEHILEQAAALCRSIHASAPRTRVIATSRTQLGVANEFAYRVPSLGLPSPSVVDSAATLEQYDGTRLFLRRAEAADTRYRCADVDARIVAEICAHLDGMPLAIEMAASRIRSFTPADILPMLSDRFRLLASAATTPIPRHQTLRTTIDWSFDLLSAEEREAFADLSVFPSTFLLKSAEDVLGRSDIAVSVGALVDHSLLVSNRAPGAHARFRFLESVREYALEKLGASDRQETLKRRHLRHFSDFVRAAEPHVQGSDAEHWIRLVDDDIDNVRCALDTAESLDCRAGLEMAVCLPRYWYVRGHYAEGLRRLQTFLAHCDSRRDAIAAKAYNGIGILAVPLGQIEIARSALTESLETRRELGDLRGVGANLSNIGLLHRQSGDLEAARGSFVDAIDIYEKIGFASGLAMALGNLGGILNEMGRYEEAVEADERALAVEGGITDTWARGICLSNLGESLCRAGDPERGIVRLLEALDLNLDLGHHQGAHYCVSMLAIGSMMVGLPDAASGLRGAAELYAAAYSVPVPASLSAELDRLPEAKVPIEAGVVGQPSEFGQLVRRLTPKRG